MSTSYFHDILGSIAERGRALLDRSGGHAPPLQPAPGTLEGLCRALLSGRGEASGVALAKNVLDLYAQAPPEARLDFFRLLARGFGPDPARIRDAWEAYERDRVPARLQRLAKEAEAPRQELFRRLNLAPRGTSALVGMRHDLLRLGGRDPELATVDDDLVHLLYSWFNRGFLVLRGIDWSTPADILERIIRYEAVHAIQGWDDLRRRVQPRDRRCFAFFHPSLHDEPLIFVEVALTRDIPGSIQELLAEGREVLPPTEARTAVFYSISNCQEGLRGISFGNFLIKQVVEELSRELPGLKTFVTLSPAPGFAPWLERRPGPSELADLREPGWQGDKARIERLRPALLAQAAAYCLNAKNEAGRPLDPVARFHLGNGARLERLNWPADTSEKGLRESHGLMVNYLYDLRFIEANHEAFAHDGRVIAAGSVRRQLPAQASRTAPETSPERAPAKAPERADA